MCNFALYDGFIDILTDILRGINTNVMRYDAVRLTVPDTRYLWNVPELAPAEHFMENCKTDINKGCDNILSLIIARNKSFVEDMVNSFELVYTYLSYEYIHKMFGNIFNIHPEKEKGRLYDCLLQTIRELNQKTSLAGIFNTNELSKFLEKCYASNATFPNELDAQIDYVTICFHKIVCAVIWACYNNSQPCNVVPVFTVLSEPFRAQLLDILGRLGASINDLNGIRLYEELYDLIADCREEIQNRVAYDCYAQFFSFINRTELQDKMTFEGANNHEKIFKLYNMLYKNVKYKLYRAYGSSTLSNRGIMRNSLPDRQIVLNYLAMRFERNDDYAEYEFTGDHARRFVIRLAKEKDKCSLTELSNPTPPYRRAIFIRFNKNELDEAIAKKQLWIIEEEFDGERILACSAIILYNDEKHSYKTFYAGDMNNDYCKKYYNSGNEMPSKYRFIDFDSIIVDDGRGNPYNRSYRGYGFQRLMLVLAEEIAKLRGCDYICATVSSFNKPSERNFILNGYEIENDTNYPFEEDDPSPFVMYIQSPIADEEIKKKFRDDLDYEVAAYRNILTHLNIAEEDYRRDMNVPREFVVLRIK